MTGFPWEMTMRIGLGILRLPPGDFWAMTPRELAAAWKGVTEQGGHIDPLPRVALNELMVRFPDRS